MKQSWIENPFRVVSYWDMNKFAAQLFLNIGNSLKYLENEQPASGTSDLDQEMARCRINTAKGMFERVSGLLNEIGCPLSSRAALRLSSDRDCTVPGEKRAIRLDEFRKLIFDEMSQHLFFWVPPDRASWHGKTGRQILGDECVNRFSKSDVANEAEQAAKCFAFGQYTACVFHLMRISEAGVKALALAIGYEWNQYPNWGKFFKQYDAQMATSPTKHVEPWLTHSQFLEDAGGNLRAVKDAWRNDTMHLDKVYDEDQARHLLAVIPSFMRHLSSKIDESGQFV